MYQSFTTNADQADFETFFFNASFTNLVSLSFVDNHPGANFGQRAYDNIVLGEASVPVPATLALCGLGLAGLGWSRRKRT